MKSDFEKWATKAGRKHNVTITGPSHIKVTCNKCKSEWSPNLQTKGELPPRWFLCPKGCNVAKIKVPKVKGNLEIYKP